MLSAMQFFTEILTLGLSLWRSLNLKVSLEQVVSQKVLAVSPALLLQLAKEIKEDKRRIKILIEKFCEQK